MSEFLAVSMYMDQVTTQKYFTGRAVYGSGDRRTWFWPSIDNELSTGMVVPFASQSFGENTALKIFARAQKAGYVEGRSTCLLTIKIPANRAVQHFLDKDIIIMENMSEETVGFMKAVNQFNYPTMSQQVIKFDVPAEREGLLRAGYELLG